MSLSYQKKERRPSFGMTLTFYNFLKKHFLKSFFWFFFIFFFVKSRCHTKKQSFFWYDNDSDIRDLFWLHVLACLGWTLQCYGIKSHSINHNITHYDKLISSTWQAYLIKVCCDQSSIRKIYFRISYSYNELWMWKTLVIWVVRI